MFFIAVAHVVSLLWQLLSFHRFIMGKIKVGLYFYLNLGIFLLFGFYGPSKLCHAFSAESITIGGKEMK